MKEGTVNESTAVVVAESQQSVTLFRTDEPLEIVERASKVADALKAVIEKQKLFTQIGPTKHVRVEGWTLCGTLLGVFPVLTWSRPLDDGRGWEARVEARTKDGDLVGAAEAQCTRSEGKPWDSRPDYALRSMAQTRATSKALRVPLGFIVSLAGYDPTPSEELAHEEPRQAQRQQGRPAQPRAIEGHVVSHLALTPEQELLKVTIKEKFGGLAGQIAGFFADQEVPMGKSMNETVAPLNADRCLQLIAILNGEAHEAEEGEYDENTDVRATRQEALLPR